MAFLPWDGRWRRLTRVGAAATAAACAAACYSDPPPDAKTGTPPATNGEYEVDFTKAPPGNPPLLGARGLVVAGGELTLVGSEKSGSTSFPIEVPAGSDARLVVTGVLPPGARLVIGRGRVRGATSQSSLATIFAPADDRTVAPPRPSAFLVAIGSGTWTDPATSAPVELGCNGSNGRTYVQRAALGGLTRVNQPSVLVASGDPNVSNSQQDLYEAPQLANLSAEVRSGGATNELYEEDGDYVFATKKTGSGEGEISVEAPGKTLFGGPFAVGVTKAGGTSMACKLSYFSCVEACARGLGPNVFGAACTADDCGKPLPANSLLPSPVDFQNGESCRQTANRNDSCNTEIRSDAQTAVTYRSAVQQVFGEATVGGNQFFVQLVRSSAGLAPRIRRITIGR